ncbi:MAG: DUF5753 domain-containing protein [Streptosporangiaceae bacterium]
MAVRQLPDPRTSMAALIAHLLRFHRSSHGEIGARVGVVIGVEKAEVSKIEHGDHPLREEHAKRLDLHWNTGGLFELLVYFSRLGHNPDWLGENFRQEQRALVIKMWHGGLVPGLLQTPDYARAGLVSGGVVDVDKDLEIRMGRQKILDRSDPPMLWAMVDQSALDRPAGGEAIMFAQLAHLLEMMERPNIGLRVIPRSEGVHTGLDGNFKIMSLPECDVGFMEACIGGRLLADPAEVRSLIIRWERISQHALPLGASRDLIKHIMKEMSV